MKYKIYNKSSINLNEIENKSIDLIITSPPYNVGHKYFNKKDKIDDSKFQILLKNFIKKSYDKLKIKGYLVIDISNYLFLKDKVWLIKNFIIEYAKKNNFYLVNYHMYFIKDKDNNFAIQGKYNNSFVLNKNMGSHSDLQVVLIFSKINKKYNLKFLKKEYIFNKENNAYWPKELILDYIKEFNIKNKIILDPFMGSGLIGKYVIKNNCFFYGYDINKKSVDQFLN